MPGRYHYQMGKSKYQLKNLATGKPVECRVQHADGSTETLRLNHSFSGPQLEWFRKGSALNLFHGGTAQARQRRAAGKAKKPVAKKRGKKVARKATPARKPAAKKRSKTVTRKASPARKPAAAKKRTRVVARKKIPARKPAAAKRRGRR